ncbi:MAG: response regulator [Hyphomicrobiaceae bacterium]
MARYKKTEMPCRRVAVRSGRGASVDSLTHNSATRVLVADDSDLNALLAERLLERIGCTTARAQNGRTAVNLVETAGIVGLPFDITLLDINMPLLDGYGAAQEIRRICTENSLPIPFIIAVTANTRPEDRLRCRLTGMDGFLAKPFSKSQLSKMITSVARMGSLVC